MFENKKLTEKVIADNEKNNIHYWTNFIPNEGFQQAVRNIIDKKDFNITGFGKTSTEYLLNSLLSNEDIDKFTSINNLDEQLVNDFKKFKQENEVCSAIVFNNQTALASVQEKIISLLNDKWIVVNQKNTHKSIVVNYLKNNKTNFDKRIAQKYSYMLTYKKSEDVIKNLQCNRNVDKIFNQLQYIGELELINELCFNENLFQQWINEEISNKNIVIYIFVDENTNKFKKYCDNLFLISNNDDNCIKITPSDEYVKQYIREKSSNKIVTAKSQQYLFSESQEDYGCFTSYAFYVAQFLKDKHNINNVVDDVVKRCDKYVVAGDFVHVFSNIDSYNVYEKNVKKGLNKDQQSVLSTVFVLQQLNNVKKSILTIPNKHNIQLCYENIGINTDAVLKVLTDNNILLFDSVKSCYEIKDEFSEVDLIIEKEFDKIIFNIDFFRIDTDLDKCLQLPWNLKLRYEYKHYFQGIPISGYKSVARILKNLRESSFVSFINNQEAHIYNEQLEKLFKQNEDLKEESSNVFNCVLCIKDETDNLNSNVDKFVKELTEDDVVICFNELISKEITDNCKRLDLKREYYRHKDKQLYEKFNNDLADYINNDLSEFIRNGSFTVYWGSDKQYKCNDINELYKTLKNIVDKKYEFNFDYCNKIRNIIYLANQYKQAVECGVTRNLQGFFIGMDKNIFDNQTAFNNDKYWEEFPDEKISIIKKDLNNFISRNIDKHCEISFFHIFEFLKIKYKFVQSSLYAFVCGFLLRDIVSRDDLGIYDCNNAEIEADENSIISYTQRFFAPNTNWSNFCLARLFKHDQYLEAFYKATAEIFDYRKTIINVFQAIDAIRFKFASLKLPIYFIESKVDKDAFDYLRRFIDFASLEIEETVSITREIGSISINNPDLVLKAKQALNRSLFEQGALEYFNNYNNGKAKALANKIGISDEQILCDIKNKYVVKYFMLWDKKEVDSMTDFVVKEYIAIDVINNSVGLTATTLIEAVGKLRGELRNIKVSNKKIRNMYKELKLQDNWYEELKDRDGGTISISHLDIVDLENSINGIKKIIIDSKDLDFYKTAYSDFVRANNIKDHELANCISEMHYNTFFKSHIENLSELQKIYKRKYIQRENLSLEKYPVTERQELIRKAKEVLKELTGFETPSEISNYYKVPFQWFCHARTVNELAFNYDFLSYYDNDKLHFLIESINDFVKNGIERIKDEEERKSVWFYNAYGCDSMIREVVPVEELISECEKENESFITYPMLNTHKNVLERLLNIKYKRSGKLYDNVDWIYNTDEQELREILLDICERNPRLGFEIKKEGRL